MIKKILCLMFVILMGNYVSSFSIDIDDTYTFDGTGEGDETAFVDSDFDSEVESYYPGNDPDTLCYNWDYYGGVNDGESLEGFDNCYYESTSERDDCISCWSSGVPGNMNIDWMGQLTYYDDEIEGRVCDGCDFDTSSIHSDYQYARMYYDCDDCGSSYYIVTAFDPEEKYTVIKPRQYVCEDVFPTKYALRGFTYDRDNEIYEWTNYSGVRDCELVMNSSYTCSDYLDEVNDTTGTTSLDYPCGFKNGYDCSINSSCASNVCLHGVCRSSDPYCGDAYCDGGETYSSCPQDCCNTDCRDEGNLTCRSPCDGYNGCSFYDSSSQSNCNGQGYFHEYCIDGDTYLECCEGAPIDCAPGEYCSGGECINSSSSPECNGTIEVNVEYSSIQPMNGSIVKLNGVQNGTTNEVGQHIITFPNVECGEDQEVSVFCYNNASKSCGVQDTSLDLLGDTDQLSFDCSLCNDESNMWITVEDIAIDTIDAGWGLFNYTINVTVHSQNIEELNVNVSIKEQRHDGQIKIISTITIPVISGSSDAYAYVSVSPSVIDANYLHIYVNPENSLTEPKEDNYVVFPFTMKKINANITIDTGFPLIDDKIRKYLKLYINDVPKGNKVPNVYIGPYVNELFEMNPVLLKRKHNPFGMKNGRIFAKNGYLNKRYNAVIGTYKYGNDIGIYAFGNWIEGTVAASKELIPALQYLRSNLEIEVKNKLIILDDYDTTALGVFDIMHNSENHPYVDKINNNQGKVAEIVWDILNDNNYEISIKTVKTTNDNTTLRMKHVNTDYSDGFKDAIVNSTSPVVLAHGMHSDLFTWEGFGKEIATDPDNARDTWLVEMYGGPTTECDTCPVYSFNDLRYYYWPALMAGVQEYSGQDNLSYVGYDLGCTVALESLENYSDGKNNAGWCFNSETGLYDTYCDLSLSPVDTFVGIGCFGNFSRVPNRNGELHHARAMEFINATFLHIENNLEDHFDAMDYKLYILKNALLTELIESVLNLIENKEEISKSSKELTVKILLDHILLEDYIFGGSPISKGIYSDLLSMMNDPGPVAVGKNVNITNAAIIYSAFEGTIFSFPIKFSPLPSILTIPDYNGTDKLTSWRDSTNICLNINSSNKNIVKLWGVPHFHGVDFDYWNFFSSGKSLDKRSITLDIVKDFLNDSIIDIFPIDDVFNYNNNCTLN